MTARISNISVHAENPDALAEFWSRAMGYPVRHGWPRAVEVSLREAGLTDDDIAARAEAWDGDPKHQRFYFTRYSHERRQRNRLHLDITPFEDRSATRDELEVECARLVSLGASVEQVLEGAWGPFNEFAIMMRDPEGNEFCLQ